MISIIICSTSNQINEIQKRNIEETIGVKYEIILIDNSNNKYNIFQAYNLGVQKAQYPYLCFCHEDICFRNNNWGKKLVSDFDNNDEIGLIGVIGIKLLPKYPFGWWAAGHKYYVGKIIANNNKRKMKTGSKDIIINNNGLHDGVACDGLFFAIPKALFSQIRFDETTYTGFHCYDLDICMQVLQINKRIKISDNILIEHYSTGNPTETFSYNCYLFHKKWNNKLPVYTKDVNLKEINKVQDQIIKEIYEDKPLAIRYRHLSSNKIYNVIYKLIKKIKRL